MDPGIRRVCQGEATTFGIFAEACFREAFRNHFPQEPLDALCRAAFAEPLLAQLIADGTWVATEGDAWHGYVSLGSITCPSSDLPSPILELARLYVPVPWQGRGVADRLMTHFLREAADRGGRSVWIQAYAGNPRALAFYRRWGFRTLGTFDLAFEALHLPHRALGLVLPSAGPSTT